MTTIATLEAALSLASAAENAAGVEHARLAAENAAAGVEHDQAVAAHEDDPSQKNGKVMLAARDARELSAAAERGSGKRLATARAAAAAVRKDLEHARQLVAARAALTAPAARLEQATAAHRKASDAALEHNIADGIRQVLAVAALTRGQADAAAVARNDAAVELRAAEDALAALDPTYAGELAEKRQEDQRRAEEARGMAEARLTPHVFAAEHQSRVSPLRGLAREVLVRAVQEEQDLVLEHQGLGAEHGIRAAHLPGLAGFSAALRELADLDAPESVHPKLHEHVGWLAARTNTRATIATYALGTLGRESKPDERRINGATGSPNGVSDVEHLNMILDGRAHEVAELAATRTAHSELGRLRESTDGPHPNAVQKAGAAARELAYSTRTNQWHGDAAAGAARATALRSMITAAAEIVLEQIEKANGRLYWIYLGGNVPVALPTAPTARARVAKLIGCPVELVREPVITEVTPTAAGFSEERAALAQSQGRRAQASTT